MLRLNGDHPELAGGIRTDAKRLMIDLRGDPPDKSAVAPRQPELDIGMAKERVFAGQRVLALHVQRRDVIRIVTVQALRQADECVQQTGARNRDNFDVRHRVGLGSARAGLRWIAREVV
jgi:hypothetical protein